MNCIHPAALICVALAAVAAGSSEPQVKTDHPFYPGELACSTLERLFRTQAELYTRVTGRPCQSDEDKALAAWYWRNLHYAHGEEGKGDYFGQGFAQADWNREYWTGLFAHGFGLCGTTHSQWTAEMDAMLGHCRSRCVGVSGHNSFEVFLTGGNYGAGRWVLLDHDISTVIFAPDGLRLLSIQEIGKDLKNLTNPNYKPERQHGWRVSGLYDDDARGVYDSFRVAEYLNGYAGPPPMVHLRSGETLRRYLKPGLDDGKTFVYWGMNYKAAGIPGPQRDRTWVNQPQNMFGSKKGTGWNAGQVRFANAVYTYVPNFGDNSYKQGVIDEAADHVTFEFYTPYVIATTPANDKPWGVYDAGGKNGLVVSAAEPLPISVSIDQGTSWKRATLTERSIDLTDAVKGCQQYLLRFDVGADKLRSAKVSWRTVCQCNAAIIPRLHDGENAITFASSDQALLCAGPNKVQAEAHVVAGKMGTNAVTLELKAPRGEKVTHVYAASWNSSGSPPAPVAYQIEYTADAGKTWRPVVKDWRIVRRTPEPNDFWSQSFTYGDAPVSNATGPIRVRFSNDGGKSYRKVEAYLQYQIEHPSPTQVTFAWRESGGELKTASRLYQTGAEDPSWRLAAGRGVEMVWVEYAGR